MDRLLELPAYLHISAFERSTEQGAVRVFDTTDSYKHKQPKGKLPNKPYLLHLPEL